MIVAEWARSSGETTPRTMTGRMRSLFLEPRWMVKPLRTENTKQTIIGKPTNYWIGTRTRKARTMIQNDEPAGSIQDREAFSWSVEYAKLVTNIDTALRLSEQWRSKREDWNKLITETESIQVETRALRVLLDRTAFRLGLQPLSSKERKP